MYVLESEFSPDMCPGVGLLDHMATLFFFLKESPYCFPLWLHQFIFPSTVWEGSLFSTPSPAFLICRHFNYGHLTSVEWYLIVLICISLIISNVEYQEGRLLESVVQGA